MSEVSLNVPKFKNGNGTSAVPVVKGASVAHRRLSKRQRAALIASIIEGDVIYKPTAYEMSLLFNVCTNYIESAQKFSPTKRAAIFAGVLR